MKQSFLASALVVLCLSTVPAISHAADVSASAAAPLSAITRNAQAAQKDASHYQWTRVNREVDRIVADAKKVEKALTSDAAYAKRLTAMKDAVNALRSARLAHNVDRMNEATQQVLAAVESMNK